MTSILIITLFKHIKERIQTNQIYFRFQLIGLIQKGIQIFKKNLCFKIELIDWENWSLRPGRSHKFDITVNSIKSDKKFIFQDMKISIDYQSNWLINHDSVLRISGQDFFGKKFSLFAWLEAVLGKFLFLGFNFLLFHSEASVRTDFRFLPWCINRY